MSHPLQVSSADGATRLYHRTLVNLLLRVVDGRQPVIGDPYAIADANARERAVRFIAVCRQLEQEGTGARWPSRVPPTVCSSADAV